MAPPNAQAACIARHGFARLPTPVAVAMPQDGPHVTMEEAIEDAKRATGKEEVSVGDVVRLPSPDAPALTLASPNC